MPRQQRVGDDFGQPPAAGNREQMLLALGLRQFDQILRRQPRGFGQHRAARSKSRRAGEPANDRWRRLLDGGELGAHFGERDARADIGQRAELDGLDQAFEHVAEQLDLFAAIAVGGQQKQVRHALDGLEMFFRRAGLDGGLDFVGDGSF